ncbi:hypothetical protein ACQ9BO_12475 [Flavobacterium sp. P21]
MKPEASGLDLRLFFFASFLHEEIPTANAIIIGSLNFMISVY